ncbi:phosphatidylinositide phosphatase SAC2-like isoform X2 [Bolinopsis microptera]|uniref:phosphatidylinositide phosphatase SAC2-like isoform X2 n=1 Tax=Bolinopsis microptera TaxID=2820187 RepID=UPI00307A1E45
MFEVFSISGHYVLHDGVKSLWCSKLDGRVVPSNSTILDESLDPVCLGTCHGIVGKIKFLPESPDNLVLIANKEVVCKLHGATVQRINDIVMLPLSLETPYLDLPACSKHTKPPKGENVTETDAKIERKLEEEFVKWFEKSFYYSEEGDISHTLTELCKEPLDKTKPIWQQAKTEYFWNENMLECLISVYNQFPELCNPWIIPVMQGYIEQAEIAPTTEESMRGVRPPSTPSLDGPLDTLTVVSRRSKYRAGTRFKRRGIDEDGCPANYVVTEQILQAGEEQLSYTIIRGSVPVYWYQPLTNYRPKPVILRSPEEALEAFQLHMDRLVATHGEVVVVNLLDSEGKEAPLGDEFAKVAYMYNNERLTYVAFDFNEYCAGMKFDNVQVLLKELQGITNKFGYTHVVRGEMRECQVGAVRVNCMDSLDRTNVVQGAIAKHTLNNLAEGVGITEDDLSVPGKLLWANNGDAISTQYAGTAALKGDYTRTGERGVAGMMRDGVSSVTRMYINVFRDTNRQAAIDIMQGLEPDLAEIRDEVREELDCIPALLEQVQHLLPTQEDNKTHNIYKSWVTQEWPSGEAKAVWLTPKSLNIVHKQDQMEMLLLSTCDRVHIGQPPDCLGHYMRIINGRTHITLRPLTLDVTQLKDVLMKMAHSIVSCRDDLGLTTQVLHGPLTKADIVDMGFDKIRSSANSFGTRIAAGAKRMIGEARGVLDHTKSAPPPPGDSGSGSNSDSPRNSPKFGKRMLNMFRRGEEVLQMKSDGKPRFIFIVTPKFLVSSSSRRADLTPSSPLRDRSP